MTPTTVTVDDLIDSIGLQLETLRVKVRQSQEQSRPKFRTENAWSADVRHFIATLAPGRTRFSMGELVAAFGVDLARHRGARIQLGKAIAAEGWVKREGSPQRGQTRKARFYERAPSREPGVFP